MQSTTRSFWKWVKKRKKKCYYKTVILGKNEWFRFGLVWFKYNNSKCHPHFMHRFIDKHSNCDILWVQTRRSSREIVDSKVRNCELCVTKKKIIDIFIIESIGWKSKLITLYTQNGLHFQIWECLSIYFFFSFIFVFCWATNHRRQFTRKLLKIYFHRFASKVCKLIEIELMRPEWQRIFVLLCETYVIVILN